MGYPELLVITLGH